MAESRQYGAFGKKRRDKNKRTSATANKRVSRYEPINESINASIFLSSRTAQNHLPYNKTKGNGVFCHFPRVLSQNPHQYNRSRAIYHLTNKDWKITITVATFLLSPHHAKQSTRKAA